MSPAGPCTQFSPAGACNLIPYECLLEPPRHERRCHSSKPERRQRVATPPQIDVRIAQARRIILENVERIAQQEIWMGLARQRMAETEVRLLREHHMVMRSISDHSQE